MLDKKLVLANKRSKYIHKLFKRESIGIGEFLILTETAVRKDQNIELPNVKWLQTELQVSFTKIKAILDPLEKKGFIIKIIDDNDHRVKKIDITKVGFSYISRLIENLPSE